MVVDLNKRAGEAGGAGGAGANGEAGESSERSLTRLVTPSQQIERSDKRMDVSIIPSATPLAELFVELSAPLMRAEDETLPPDKWVPQKLLPRHREIMRRLVEGASYMDISEEMGITPQAITLITNSAIFKGELTKLEAEADSNVIRRAEALSHEALDTLKNLMRRARTESVRKTSADSILDRAGYSKIEKRVIASVSGEDVIRELNRRRREAASEPSGDSGSANPSEPTAKVAAPPTT